MVKYVRHPESKIFELNFFLFCQVAKASFQRNNDPLDAAIFYLALKKKAVVWGLYRYANWQDLYM